MSQFKEGDYVRRKDRKREQVFQIIEIDTIDHDHYSRARLKPVFSHGEKWQNLRTWCSLDLLEPISDMETIAIAAEGYEQV